MTKEDALRELRTVCRVAIEYVGSANYQHRENHALKQVENSFTAYMTGNFDKIGFFEENEDEQ